MRLTAKLLEFLYELTEALERHYGAELRRYYQPRADIGQRDLDVDPPSTDPSF